MRNIHSIDALRSFLQTYKNIELLSTEWDCNERSKITGRCFCGNIFTKPPRYIVSLNNPCGCINRKKKIETLTKQLKETKNLEVVSKDSEWRGCNSDTIKLKCFCGKIFESKVKNIKYRADSCGCLMYQYKSGSKNYLWKGIGDLSAHAFHSIKSGATQRNIGFDITIDDAWNAYINQKGTCALSGVPLLFNTNHNDRNSKTASLDRIDSTKGYVNGNIQWIHKTLNKMKMDLQLNEFINLCRLIVNPLSHAELNDSVNIKLHNNNFKGYKNISNTKFNEIKRGAIGRNIYFDITIVDMWNKFIDQGGYCALTGLPIEFKYKKNSASLDRIDSSMGYTIDNIQWVHTTINTKLKQTLTETQLKYWCSLICEHTR